jgi:DNA-directed RNA polymerase specialized sigma24 family protein
VNKEEENNIRLSNLYKQSHKWLLSVAYNTTKDKTQAEELVSDVYLYLAERINPKLWWGVDSFNLMYLRAFIQTRWLNKIKVQKRLTSISPHYDTIEEEYDVEFDKSLDIAFNQVIEELKDMERTSKWPSSKLYQLYALNDEMTLEKLSSEIKLSKSTVFLQVKKCKKHLKDTIQNPFK